MSSHVTVAQAIQEIEYWLRLATLLHEPLKESLLAILHNDNQDPTYVGLPRNPAHLFQELQKHRNIIRSLNKRKVLSQDQVDLLLPPNSNQTDSQTFDITLIIVLIVNFTTLPPPKNGWRRFGNPSDLSIAAFVVLAREWRNSFMHTDAKSITLMEFNLRWTEGERIVRGLGFVQYDFNALRNRPLDVTNNAVVKSLSFLSMRTLNELGTVRHAQALNTLDTNKNTSDIQTHNQKLKDHETALNDHDKALARHDVALARHDVTLAFHETILKQHTVSLTKQSETIERLVSEQDKIMSILSKEKDKEKYADVQKYHYTHRHHDVIVGCALSSHELAPSGPDNAVANPDTAADNTNTAITINPDEDAANQDDDPVNSNDVVIPNIDAVNPDIVAANSDIVAENPDIVAANPDIVEVNPEIVAANPDNVAANPDNVAANPEIAAANPDNVAANPNNVAANPDIVAANPDIDANNPDIDANNPDINATNPDVDATNPDFDAANPNIDAAKPDNDAVGHNIDPVNGLIPEIDQALRQEKEKITSTLSNSEELKRLTLSTVKRHENYVKYSLAINEHLTISMLEALHNNGLPRDEDELYRYFDKKAYEIQELIEREVRYSEDPSNVLLPKNGKTKTEKWDITLIAMVSNIMEFNGKMQDLFEESKQIRMEFVLANANDYQNENFFNDKWDNIRRILEHLSYNRLTEFDQLREEDAGEDLAKLESNPNETLMANIENFIEDKLDKAIKEIIADLVDRFEQKFTTEKGRTERAELSKTNLQEDRASIGRNFKISSLLDDHCSVKNIADLLDDPDEQLYRDLSDWLVLQGYSKKLASSNLNKYHYGGGSATLAWLRANSVERPNDLVKNLRDCAKEMKRQDVIEKLDGISDQKRISDLDGKIRKEIANSLDAYDSGVADWRCFASYFKFGLKQRKLFKRAQAVPNEYSPAMKLLETMTQENPSLTVDVLIQWAREELRIDIVNLLEGFVKKSEQEKVFIVQEQHEHIIEEERMMIMNAQVLNGEGNVELELEVEAGVPDLR